MPRPTTLDILYDDSNLIAINKSASLATIPGRGESTSCLEQLAAEIHLPCTGSSDPRLRVVHRLDKDTTGVLLFAKNIDAQRHLSHQFQNNTIQKEYLALVVGVPREKSGEIDAPLAPHPTQKDRMHVSKNGRPARTDWKVEESFRRYALLRCFPKTGKTHQIRVHLQHIGHPLAVDTLYGHRPPLSRNAEPTPPGLYLSQFKRDYRPTAGEDERPLIGRLTLHAEKLTFINLDGQLVTIEAPVPKDFRASLNQLRRHGR